MTQAIIKHRFVPIPKSKAWELWSTRHGLESFLAPEARIELWPGSPVLALRLEHALKRYGLG